MNEVNTRLYATLAGDATLTALLATTTSIFHLQAPPGTHVAYVVFNKQSETEPNDSPHRVLDMIYQVSAYTKDGALPGAKAAYAIDTRVQVLLHGVSLTISDHALLRINRIGGLEDVPSEPNVDTVYKVGSLYRIRLERTT